MTNNSKFKKRELLGVPIFLFLLCISFTSAAIDTNDVDDIFQVNTVVAYAKPCINNGTYCSAAAICNYTVFNPSNVVTQNNVLATNNGAYHNLSIGFHEIGIWKIDMVCHDGGKQGAETFFAQVTGSGFNDSFGFYILILGISFGVILLGFYLGDAPITILGTFGLYFVGLYILFNGIVGVKDLTTTWAIGVIILSVAMYISVKSAHEIITG